MIQFNCYNNETHPHLMVGKKAYAKRTLLMTSNGCFFISARAATELGVVAGDRIAFLQDQTFTTDWYITKYDSLSGFLLEKCNKNRLTFRSNTLAKAISEASLKNVDFRCVSFSLYITEHGLCLDVKNPKVTLTTRK